VGEFGPGADVGDDALQLAASEFPKLRFDMASPAPRCGGCMLSHRPFVAKVACESAEQSKPLSDLPSYPREDAARFFSCPIRCSSKVVGEAPGDGAF
jgi:hypothetical protein